MNPSLMYKYYVVVNLQFNSIGIPFFVGIRVRQAVPLGALWAPPRSHLDARWWAPEQTYSRCPLRGMPPTKQARLEDVDALPASRSPASRRSFVHLLNFVLFSLLIAWSLSMQHLATQHRLCRNTVVALTTTAKPT